MKQKATHPIDTLKVKVQLTGNGRTSATQVLKNIVKCHQLSSLFWGLEAALLRSVTYGSVRYAIYSPIKKILDGEKETSSNQNGSSFGVKVLSGSISGCLASGVCNPTDLIKVRMQSGTHEGYSTVSSAIRKIVSEQGLRGLWVGSGPTCMRATVLAAAELSTYDQGKETILKSGLVEDGPIVHFSASLFAGFVSAAVTNPFDFAKSRIMSQQIDIYGRGTLYRSTFDCMLKSVRHEGFPVLWSGAFILLMLIWINC